MGKNQAFDAEENKIPVFTVLKNNAILKNIFVVNQPPPSIPDLNSIRTVPPDALVEDCDEILLVGRHPDCNIVLEHPSISRFHLRILSRPSSQRLSVIDLSSVHGTWISGKKIEPNVLVELNEGDSMRIGGSSRVYRLHWLPLSRAYDLDNPFVPDELIREEGKEEIKGQTEEGDENTLRDENSLFTEAEQIETSDIAKSAAADDKSGPSVKILTPNAPPLQEDLNTFSLADEEIAEQLLTEPEVIETLDIDLEVAESAFGDENWAPPLEEDTKTFSLADEKIAEQLLTEPEGIQMLDIDPEVAEFADENSGCSVKKLSPTAPPLPFSFVDEEMAEQVVYHVTETSEELESLFPSENGRELKESSSLLLVPQVTESAELFFETGNQEFDKENQYPQSSFSAGELSERESFEDFLARSGNESETPDNKESPPSKEEMAENEENLSPLRKDHGQKDTKNKEYENEGPNSKYPDSCQATEGSSERENLESPPFENKQLNKENQTPSLRIAIEGSTGNVESPPIGSETSKQASIWSRRRKPASVLQLQTSSATGKKKQFSLENQIPICYAAGELFDSVESSSTQAEPNSDVPSAHSRKGKPGSILQLQTGSTRGTRSISKALEHGVEAESISKTLFHASDEEEENFTPDKENMTPNTRILKSIKRMGNWEESKHSRAYRSSPLKATVGPDVNLEKDAFASCEKENQRQEEVLQERSVRSKSRTRGRVEAEWMPLQPLLANSTGKSKSEASARSATTKSSNSVNCRRTIEGFGNPSRNKSIGEGKRSWNMVVDSTCLLKQESRKSLQLLQGLKGTRLIVPRIVIRELDCLRRRGGLFRGTAEVSSALRWIEDCMAKTRWWIHVQSSAEELRSVAPTPPASPGSQIGEGITTSSIPFSRCGSFAEILSPTAEDHILDYALLSRRIMNEEQLVLLSNDVTLKIKAMAEGLICETAEEFRESLVNPFSERFLWADSSPRGQTWSCTDDVVLKEKYDRCTSKRPLNGAEAAKGLKLILLHNSQYGQHISLGS